MRVRATRWLAMTGSVRSETSPRHCEELLLTKQSSLPLWFLDCFASLAMTGRKSYYAQLPRYVE